MQISKNFTTEEMGIRENTDIRIAVNACSLVYNVLQPLRNLIGEPITITSGIRTIKKNEEIGGTKRSQHLLGEAADFTCKNLIKAYNILTNSNIKFDQLIYYRKKNFIHISHTCTHNRRQIIIK